MSRFLQAWFFMTLNVTIAVGVVASWHSNTLTFPLDTGLVVGFALAIVATVFSK